MNSIDVFKGIVEEFYISIPNETKKRMYQKHILEVEEKNKFRKSVNENKKKGEVNKEMLENSILLAKKKRVRFAYNGKTSEDFYNIKPMAMTEYIKSKIALMLLDSNYNFLVSGGLELEKIAYIYDISRERVRQVEEKAKAFFKNLEVLKTLNKNGNVEEIMEKAYELVEAKRKRGLV